MIKSVQNDVTLQIPDVTLYSTVWLLVGFFCFMCECEWIIFCCWTFSSPSNWFMKWLFISWPNLSFYLSLCLPGCLCACWQKQLLPKQQLASCGWKKNNKEQDNSKPDSSLNPVCSAHTTSLWNLTNRNTDADPSGLGDRYRFHRQSAFGNLCL